MTERALIEIGGALRTRMTAAYPGAELAAAKIAFQNYRYEPTAGTRWYRATLIPSGQRPVGFNSNSRIRNRGIFQIDIFEPEGAGTEAADLEAGRIAARYAPGTILTYLNTRVLIENSEILQGIQEPDSDGRSGWYQVPISIEWVADIER